MRFRRTDYYQMYREGSGAVIWVYDPLTQSAEWHTEEGEFVNTSHLTLATVQQRGYQLLDDFITVDDGL